MSSGTLVGTDVFDKMVDSVACYERDGTIVLVNPAACRRLGRSRDELVGRSSWTSFADSRDTLHQAFERVARTGHAEQLSSFDAESGRWYDNHVYLADGRVWVVSRDVTDERAASARLEILANASRAFSEAAADPRTVFEKIARHVAEVLHDLCSIRLMSASGEHFDAPIGIWDTDPECQQRLKDTPSAAASDAVGAEILRTGKPIVMSNMEPVVVASRIANAARRTVIEQLAIHSVMLVPLKAQGRVLGLISVARRRAGTRAAYTDADLRLLEELADRAALVVDQWRVFRLVEESREQLSIIGDSVPVLVSLVDKDERYRFVNATYKTWFGFEPAALLGKTVREVVGEAAYQLLEPNVKAALSGQSISVEARVPYSTGGHRDVQITYTPYRGASHLEGYVALVADVTERVRLEESLRRWETLFRHAGWGVAMEQPETGQLLALNAAFAKMHGYEPHELLGKPLSHVVALESQSELRGHMEAAHQNGHHQYEAIHVRKDGSRFPCLTDISASKDAAGKVVYRAANVQDITAQKNTEATLRATIALRDEFLSIASHELRTPLTALSLQLDGLERSFEREGARLDLERARRKLTMAVRQTERLSALIDGLLDVSEVSVGGFWLEVEEFEPNDMIADVVSRLGLESERVGSTITTELGLMRPVRWDRSRMDQALTILLSNALKYGGGKEIAVESSAEGERVSISVRDLGIGIAEKEHERIFLRFERAVSSHHYGGFGLGLYIANQIVRAHSGSIRVQSRPGEGSVFTLTLPRLAPELAADGSSLADHADRADRADRQMNARGT